MNGKIFISYCWAEPSGSIVNNWLVPAIKTAGINCLVDREACGYNVNIDKFEADILNAAIVLLVLSPEFFCSMDCMYEASLAVSKCDVDKRVYVINLQDFNFRSDTKIFNETHERFLEKKRELEEAMSKVSVEGRGLHKDRLRKINTIIGNLSKLWKMLGNKNSGEFKHISKRNFELLCIKLKRSLEETVYESDFITNAELEPKFEAPSDNTPF